MTGNLMDQLDDKINQLQLDNEKLRGDIVKVKDVFLTGFGTPQQRIDKCLGILSLSTTSQPVVKESLTAQKLLGIDKDFKLNMSDELPTVDKSLTVQNPLSDEEIFKLSMQCDLNHILGLIDYGRAIEKAHGIVE